MLSEIFIASLVLAWDEAFTRVGGTSPGDVTQQGDRDEQGSELATLVSPGLGQKDEECEGKGWKESDREGICLHKLLPPAPPVSPVGTGHWLFLPRGGNNLGSKRQRKRQCREDKREH